MVDLMNLLSDVLIGSFQMLMLNDLGKNMFPYRIKTCWTRILIYGVTALVILGVNHIESTFINIMMVPVSYTIASIVIFQGSVWKKIILTCCYYIPYWDVSKGENICEYNDFRQQMGNHVYDTGKWPMFGIAIAKKAEESILHFSMDFLIADWTSIWMLLSEFEALYYLKKDSINVPQITFRDYLSAERKLKESERYVNDKRYWEKRIAYLPDAPELPTLSAEDVKKNFTRKLLCLDSERWNSFKDAAKKLGITPSTAILTAYSDVIAKWSCNKSFCINLTVLNRFPLHDDVTDIVGDFTTLNLLEINANDGNNFAERARKINERLFIDLDHRLFGGVEVIRELSKQRNKRVFMPIVYTSAIGLADQNRQITGKFDGGITQTPQVFIDCQAMDGDFGLQINWDVREGVFPDGMIDDMFDLFQQRIEELAKDETDWNKINGLFLPQWQADERNVANHTETDLPIHLLQSGFMEWAQKAPDRVAVTDGEKKLTYGELHQYALKIRQKIVNVGAKHQDCIAIAMNKSIYQVAAVLGTLYAGCIYVPIVADQEIERAKKILEITNANIVLTTVAENSEYMSGKAIIEVDALSDIKFETELPEYGLEDVAYIIFTSGSTGEPKGVTITHAAAVNTIEDINNKNKVTCDDSVLGLSKLNFDLSVYDIFGLLQVGGKIVYPIQENYMNPDHWIKMIEEHRITIWNSVPALMKILLTELETMNTTHMLPLRCVLLSGDWIPVNMPSQIKEIVPMAKINCLGGATEASIWSINHEFCDERIYEKIPYGKPLSNQAMDVCNEDGESCPVWVQGEIIIKGKGLAKGYFNDDNLTNQKFILDKNGRLSYLTGDIGHYLPGGDIEFIGRKDNQIKIRGYRIELGEVENVLKKVENIKDAIAVVSKEKNEILAMVEPASITSEMVLEREKFCQELFDTVLSYDEHYFMEFDQEKVQLAVDSRNEAAAYSLLYGLQKMGILLKNKPILMEEILNDSVIPDKYRWLTVPWLKALLKSGLIRKRNDGKFEAIENVEWSQKEQQWNVAFDKWYDKLGNVSTLEYIKLNADEFANIMSGKTDPVSLLYPDGSNKYTQALYVENTATKYINASICKIIKKVQKRVPGQKIKILEVGAGTGATTEWVFKALEGSEFEYCFTDISKYFFPDAVNRFGKNPNVTIKKLDLNEDFVAQGFCPNSYDVIIGAYVLNNVKDIVKTINKLKELVRNEGYLIFSETILPETWLLVSQALMMTPPEDTLRDGAAFISKDLWCGVLKESDGVEESVLSIPSNNNPTSLLGAGLFIKQFKRTDVFLDKMEINRRLEKYLPAYMLPSEICIIDRIPLSANGKIDRKAVEDWFERYRISEDKIAEKEETKTDLEKMICQIWCEALDIGDLGRKENFYDYGADSLIMAQVTTKVRSKLEKEIPFDALLRQMLNTPTIEEIALYISAYDNQEIESPMCEKKFEYIAKNGERNGNRGRILLHGALGSVDVYRYLIPEMEKQNCGEIISIGISDLDEYCKLESEEVVLHLADLYTQKILEENLDKVQIVGYSFSGVIAIEMATFFTGAQLKLVKELRDTEDIKKLVDSSSDIVWNSVPAAMELFIDSLDEDYKNDEMKAVLLSGDWINVNLPDKIKKHFPKAAIFSLGGATEASIWSIYYPIKKVDASWTSIPYGYPLTNQSIYILDSEQRICPPEVIGEIYIGGIGVAKGYINDEEKTSNSFVKSKYGRLYRTGDFGKYSREGYVIFCGRRDSQVKIGGYRIELEEIEAQIKEVPNIKDCIAVVNYKNQIVVFYKGEELDIAEIKRAIRKKLPTYMYPHRYYRVDDFPLNTNEKIDRKMLKSMADSGIQNKMHNEKQDDLRNPSLNKVIEIWSEVLNCDVEPENDFFELGGDSIKAQRIVRKIADNFKVKISFLTVIHSKNVAEFSKEVEKISLSFKNSKKDEATSAGSKQDNQNVFPLTGVQLAYLNGRNDNYELGKYNAHYYFEAETEYTAILITQSFMMTEPKDQRKATNTMFLNRKQWLEILEENGFCNSEEFPGYGEYLEVLGQKLFYCTKE